MWASAKLFFRGPMWAMAGTLGVIATVIGALGDHFWTWLSAALFLLVAAAFWTFHREREKRVAELASLPRRIDDLHREGIDLLGELRQPVEPEEHNGTWSMSLTASPDRWDKVEAFDEKTRALLIAEYPALLTDYADGFNKCRRKTRQREADREPDPEQDERSDAEKLRQFADRQHERPAAVLEATLEGLAVARHRLGTRWSRGDTT